MTILAVTFDSREPQWVKNLTMHGAAIAVAPLPAGDAEIYLDDGQVLIVERKASEDFLLSIKDGRLFDQASRLVERRTTEQLSGQPISTWPYILITGTLRPSGKDMVITDRGETAWHWESVNSAILTLQEMGVFVGFARDDGDYERALLALGNRKRGEVRVMPARSFELVSPQAAFLMGLPGIGEERSSQILQRSGNNLSTALVGLTDPALKQPVIGKAVQTSVRRFLNLPDGIILDLKQVEET
jgi:ERCC4-type nuclease